MPLTDALILFVAGCFGGWINVMAGGGSMLSVPVLLFLGLPGPVANGTNRVAILAQNAAAVSTFFKQGFSDFRLSLSLASAAIPGAIVGATLGTRLDGAWFDRVLALTMLGVLIVMFLPKRKAKFDGETGATSPSKQRLIIGHVLMFGAGIWGGFIQIGVGFILMPILHKVLGLDLVRVNMHKVFIVLCYTVFALLVFANLSDVVWLAGLALAAGMALGGWFGARTTVAKGETWIRYVFGAVLLVFIAKLLFY